MKLITLELNTKLENTVNRPAIPAITEKRIVYLKFIPITAVI